MKKLNTDKNHISRRNILPILGGSLLLPFLGFGSNVTDSSETEDNGEYKILLRKDGTTVKVKTSTLKALKSEEKNISNNSLYNWLKDKF
ncbi:hypothetical protein [Mariniflexile sp.]|uniref:hypothetical protein n=1 Tax=Mariniflexile sp. TaxID=1979402 RepID=UPI004047193B